MRFYNQVTVGLFLAVSKLPSNKKTYRHNFTRGFIRGFAHFIFVSAICWIPNKAFAVMCGNGLTPAIVGYSYLTDSYVYVLHFGITIQPTPQAACVAWYSELGHAAAFAGSDFKLGMMTTGKETTLSAWPPGPYNTQWFGSGEWTCDVVPLRDPDIRICLDLNRPCMGQQRIFPVLQCSNPPLPPPNCHVGLSGLPAEVEPGGAINNLRAEVTCDGAPAAKDVVLTVKAVELSGGHNHIPGRPDGSLNPSSGSSPFSFSFVAPAPAGDHTITARCTDGSCGEATGSVWVGIQGLVHIPSSGFWNLIGVTSIHPVGWYLTGDALGKLMDLGRLYKHVYFPFAKPLQLNDASLERGGVFDIDFIPYTDKNGVLHSRTSGSKPGVFWAPPHHEHRRGVVIDIQANGAALAIPQENFADFEDLMLMLGMTWNPEYLNESGGHYHVRLLGVAQ